MIAGLATSTASIDRRPRVRIVRGAYLHPSPRTPAPDPSDHRAVQNWVRHATGPTAIDLFCGAGGLSLGLHDAGFRVLVGADSDRSSVETHRANLGSLGYEGDLSDAATFLSRLRSWGIRQVDLVAGGVPCQPFSRAGRSKIQSLVAGGHRPAIDPRAGLWRSFVQIVAGLRPRAVVLENVPDLTVWNNGAVLSGVLDALSSLGYQSDARLLNTSDFWVPQHRSRLVIVAVSGSLQFEWPEPCVPSTVDDAIGDLPEVPPAQRKDALPYAGPASALQRRLRRDVPLVESAVVFDHITRDVRPDDAEAFALLCPGGTYIDLPDRLRRYRSDIFDDKYKRLEWFGLSRSITAHIAKDGYWYIHPDQNRTLSIREAARIQTFPDWFRFAGMPTAQYRQIGNAVPPLLAEAVGRQLIKALRAPSTHKNDRGPVIQFRDRLIRWHRSHARDLEWRRSSNPWSVLVAARCLARRSVEDANRLLPQLMAAVPTPDVVVRDPAVVEASVGRLGVKGFVDLRAIASAIVCDHSGSTPTTTERLRQLPSVGETLAAEAVVYGAGGRAVVLDAAAERLAKRLRGAQVRGSWQARVDLQRLAGGPGPDAAFNAAIADLANRVCLPVAPTCSDCPVVGDCATGRAGVGGDREE